MNIIFMGTPEFAVPCLQCLLQERHQVSLVVTQGDKPKGRGHQLAFPPVKEYALANHLPVFQPVSLKSEEAYQSIPITLRTGIIFIMAAFPTEHKSWINNIRFINHPLFQQMYFL